MFTDHAACTSLLNSRNPSSKMVRWAMVIQELNLDIHHCSGKSNYVADALSRNPVEVANVLAFQSVESPSSSLTPESDIEKLQRCDKEFLPIFQSYPYSSSLRMVSCLQMKQQLVNLSWKGQTSKSSTKFSTTRILLFQTRGVLQFLIT